VYILQRKQRPKKLKESGMLKIQVLRNVTLRQVAEAGNSSANITNYLAINTA
jgi:hypothetical protein